MSGLLSSTRQGTSLWRWPLSRSFDRAPLLSNLALLATVAAVGGVFALSPVTLESLGIPYLTPGGGMFSKVHPSTVVAALALGLRCLATRRPLRAAWRLATSDAGAVLMVVAFVIASADAAVFSHTPVTPMIDTFILPVMTFLLLRDLDPVLLRRLAIFVIAMFCLNAVLSILEMVLHRHFPVIVVAADASADPTRGNATFDWRAQLANDTRSVALFGHPLTDGLLTGALLICFAAAGSRWLPMIVKAPVALLQILAMGTFGARTAVVLSTLALVMYAVRGSLAAMRKNYRLTPKAAAGGLLLLCVVVVGSLVIYDSGLADQTIDRFQNDSGSATTRITMFDLFTPLSTSDILLGPDADVVATQQRLQGLEFGIESSWIGLVLTYGLVVTAIILSGLAAFSWSVLKASGRGAGTVLIYFFILVSVAASLSTKTTIFAMLVALIMTVLQKDAAASDGHDTRFGVA